MRCIADISGKSVRINKRGISRWKLINVYMMQSKYPYDFLNLIQSSTLNVVKTDAENGMGLGGIWLLFMKWGGKKYPCFRYCQSQIFA